MLEGCLAAGEEGAAQHVNWSCGSDGSGGSDGGGGGGGIGTCGKPWRLFVDVVGALAVTIAVGARCLLPPTDGPFPLP